MRLALLLVLFTGVVSAEFRAGVARARITPATPSWLVGFAARTKPVTTIGLDLYAKALALDAGAGHRAVIITADLIGFTQRVSNEVAARAATKHKLRRDQIFFYASHTHSGPAVLDEMTISVGEGPEFDKAAETYTSTLIDQIDTMIDQALSKLEPAQVTSGWSTASFSYNRRTTLLERIRPGETFPAPTDQRVPVILVKTTVGQPLAYLFGFACHATVLTGDTYEISGDYPGYAQQAIEQQVPGVTAMFIQLTAGDQGSTPRGTRELAQQHGKALATAALSAKLTPLGTTLTTAMEEIELPFASHTREAYNAEAQSKDIFAARRGKKMLAAMDAKRMPLKAPYPLQALKLGTLTLLAMPGEVVVDYALRNKAKYGNQVITGAYASYLPGYIPSLRVQREGGYEAGDSLMYFQQPGWFTDQVEPMIHKATDRLIQKLTTKSPVR